MGLNPLQGDRMQKRRIRILAVTGSIVSATVLTALSATGASATVTATANPAHPNVAASTVAPAAPTTANHSTTPDSSTAPYTIHSVIPGSHVGGLGCIGDPGHGNVVYVRFTCTTTFNLVFQETTAGFAWYWLRYNGTNECLNWSPANGFVYDDSCIPDDPNEMWQHHDGDLLGNFANGNNFLVTCNDTGNSRLITNTFMINGCSQTSPAQENWQFIQE